MDTAKRTALALTHVPFEDLDALRPTLEARGFSIQYAEATAANFPARAALDADLLIVLGGPIGVYELEKYPFLLDELKLVRERLAAQKPTIGICLGAQLMAAALGAKVYPGKNGAEIGWSPLHATATTPKWFQPLLAPGIEVMHWHGDTFDLPTGATHLASSEKYQNQAFAVGNYALGLQFHVEVTAAGLERWYVGHTCELGVKGIDVSRLRAEGKKKAPVVAEASKVFWNHWLDVVFPQTAGS
ncbi:glutamine amidotransferase [Telmatobacter bradus]|uniref:glutamine amidotransferase n=1 Tax=Telmatobacter bradus TaxID=474953 RepID=UPI003B43375A